MTGLALWIGLMTHTASAAVVTLPAGSCMGGDDTAVLQAALGALRSGDTLLLPAMSTCMVTNGLVLGDWRVPGGLQDIVIDGNGATIRASYEMTTAGELPGVSPPICHDDSHHYGPAARRYPILTIGGVDDLGIFQLQLDGNATARAAEYGLATSAKCASSSNLRLQVVRRVQMSDVTSLDAFSDGLFIGGLAGQTVGLEVDRYVALDAGRNSITVANCTDCEVRHSTLEGGLQAFDIEPDYATQRVSAVKVLDSKLGDTEGRCASISSPYDVVSDIVLSRNLFTRCALDDSRSSTGRIFAFHSGASHIVVTDNHFYNIDVTGSSQRRLISLSGSAHVRFENNIFEDVLFNAGSQNLLYIWNDSAGKQATHVFRDNDIRTLPPRPAAPATWWCYQGKHPSYTEAIESQVYRNEVPTPGGGSTVVNGCLGI